MVVLKKLLQSVANFFYLSVILFINWYLRKLKYINQQNFNIASVIHSILLQGKLTTITLNHRRTFLLHINTLAYVKAAI